MKPIQRLTALCLMFFLSVSIAPPVCAAATAQDFSSTAEYARVLRSFNPNLSHAQSRAFADRVRLEAEYYRLDARLLVALVATESAWHPYVTSPVGAGGLGQLMPGTAAGLGVNAYSPYANLNGTAHYLRGLLDRFGSYDQRTRYAFALAGYNAGPAAVERYGGIPPYTETQNYVRNVMGIWRHLSLTLSSHIDDYVQSTAYAAHPRPPLLLARTARHILALETPAPLPARHKPFLYYLFHHEGTNTLVLHVPASVSGGRPIPVSLEIGSATPVTLTAFVGARLVARGTMSVHSKRTLLHGVASTDAARVVVIHAYAQGYSETTAALTIPAAQKPVHVAATPKLVTEER
jgi:hypothetical protein